jgi:hypothetical protein
VLAAGFIGSNNSNQENNPDLFAAARWQSLHKVDTAREFEILPFAFARARRKKGA